MAVLLAVACPVADGKQSCGSQAFTQDSSLVSMPRMQAVTTNANCAARTAKVVGWIDGVVWDCLEPETRDALSNCVDEGYLENASVTVGSTSATCGSWRGRSNHAFTEFGTTITIESGKTTMLNARCDDDPPPTEEDPCEYDPASCGIDPGDQGETPIVIELARGASYRLSSPEEGVMFDIDGNGTLDRIAWTLAGGETAFLAVDRDGDGAITSGRELFGNHTYPGASNGFQALQRMNMESNGGEQKGSVSAEDPLFARLLLWTDSNHNGVSEPGELRPASEAVSDVGLGYRVVNRRDKYGNWFRYQGWVHVRTAPGRNSTKSPEENRQRTRPIWDVVLGAAK